MSTYGRQELKFDDRKADSDGTVEENGYYWSKKPDTEHWEPVAIVNGTVQYIGQTVSRPRKNVSGEFRPMKSPDA